MESFVKSWAAEVEFEKEGPLRRLIKKLLVNPFANYMPAGFLKAILRWSKSELAAANWADPGGWRSMAISYDGRPKQIADKILVGTGAVPMALRNRRRLAARLLAGLIDESDHRPPHILCLGAGAGQIIIDAMSQATAEARATLVDLNPDAFGYGRKLAASAGLTDKIRFIVADVRDVGRLLDEPPHIVKMVGILEYLTDEQIASIVQAASQVMPPGAYVVYNNLSKAHGMDRFFRRVFGLHMIHRSLRQLEGLMSQAGLTDFISIPEPLGVYHVVVARKPGPPSARAERKTHA
ncbi:MAG TPA: methyltransferase domain-containing protein [Phycisphaerae bacterium]|nr:methyltransferase domain-containing protein [Phycisphaerae bacterium]